MILFERLIVCWVLAAILKLFLTFNSSRVDSNRSWGKTNPLIDFDCVLGDEVILPAIGPASTDIACSSGEEDSSPNWPQALEVPNRASEEVFSLFDIHLGAVAGR